MVTIELSAPVKVVVVREDEPKKGDTARQSLLVKEICLPRNLEVYLNEWTGVLLIRQIDRPDNE